MQAMFEALRNGWQELEMPPTVVGKPDDDGRASEGGDT